MAIKSGAASIIVAGGMESMSLSPHAMHLRTGTKFGDATMIDTMIKDGLWDAFNDYHMGITAENVASKFGITRDMQDQFALASQNKAEAAMKSGRFKDEIVPVIIKGRKGDVTVDQDEGPRAGTALDALAKLKPAFTKDGTVTAGNASTLNDGAAALILMTEEDAAKRGLTPLARIASWATCGVDPAIMGTGPIPSSRKALDKAGWKIADLDLIEANEAFAAQACAVNKEMGWDTARSMSMAAQSRWAILSARRARVFLLLCCMKCKNARRKKASRLYASAAAWASRCAWKDKIFFKHTEMHMVRGSSCNGRNARYWRGDCGGFA